MGLRERKKERTRLALIDAALDLFLAQGYHATTVDQIAAAVEVSPRTFFRYFHGKEELVFYYDAEGEEVLLAEMADRPPAEHPFTALANAYRAVLRVIAEGEPDDHERFLKMRRVVEANPELIAAGLARTARNERRLAEHVARHMGVDPETDPRPLLLVTFASSAVRAGFECHPRSATDDLTALVRQVDDTLTLAERMVHL